MKSIKFIILPLHAQKDFKFHYQADTEVLLFGEFESRFQGAPSSLGGSFKLPQFLQQLLPGKMLSDKNGDVVNFALRLDTHKIGFLIRVLE